MHFMGLRILRDLSQNIYQIFEPLTSNIEDMTYQEYLIKYRVQSPNKDARDKKTISEECTTIIHADYVVLKIKLNNIFLRYAHQSTRTIPT